MDTDRKRRETGLRWVSFLLVLAIALGTAALAPGVSAQAGASDGTPTPPRHTPVR